MRRLDGLSAFMVYSEKPKWYQHTLKIAVLDYGGQPVPTFDELVQLFSENIKRIPMLKWKLARVPLGINHPVWVQAHDFDIRYHLRHVSCPAPGGERELSKLVSEIYAYPMDQSAPMWLTWIVEGLDGGKVAVVTLVHHAYTDGTGAARMLERMLVPRSGSNYPIAEIGNKRSPGKLKLFAQGLIDLPLLFIRELPGIIRGFRTLSRYKNGQRKMGRALPPELSDAPYSPFNNAMSHRRTFVYKTFSFAEIKNTSQALGFTINDLFVASCAGAFRRFLADTDFDLQTGPLVCTLPVNFRPPPSEDDLVGNLQGTAFMAVPIQLDDPLERLQATHDSGQAMKSFLAATRDVNLARLLQILPPLYARAMEWIVERTRGEVNTAGNMILSNVVGPREPLRIGNATVENWLSIGQVSGGAGLNITVWSYAQHFNV